MDNLTKFEMAESPPQTEDYPTKSENEKIFWVKVGFSALFSLAAFFVILSKKYDEEIRKWAFSVLTLIAGVWIGSAS